MDSWSAFAMGEANRGKERMVFDWKRAAELIREHKPRTAVAGLSSDMEYTAGTIIEDGVPTTKEHSYTYLASTWATPVLVLDDGDEIPCYIMETETPYNEGTFWPEDALAILNAATE